MKTITVLIPCYNEAKSIGDLIRRFPKTLIKNAGYQLQILVVDNNSSDNTAEIAKAAGAIVVTETKQGKGNAVKTGFYNIPANTDYVVMLDGDGTYAPEEILRMVEPIDSGFAKVIIGSRMEGKIQNGSMPTFNRVGNKLYSQMVRSAYKVAVTDVLSGYYAWSIDVIETIRPHIRSEDFTIEMEMITKMARFGYQVFCVPISYDMRVGESNLKPLHDGSRILYAFIRNLNYQSQPAARRHTGRISRRRSVAFGGKPADDYQVESMT